MPVSAALGTGYILRPVEIVHLPRECIMPVSVDTGRDSRLYLRGIMCRSRYRTMPVSAGTLIVRDPHLREIELGHRSVKATAYGSVSLSPASLLLQSVIRHSLRYRLMWVRTRWGRMYQRIAFCYLRTNSTAHHGHQSLLSDQLIFCSGTN